MLKGLKKCFFNSWNMKKKNKYLTDEDSTIIKIRDNITFL